MRYIIDNDLHIHTYLSKCSNDKSQNKDAILEYAKKYNLKLVCITDHMWESNIKPFNPFYEGQDYKHIKEILPLYKDDSVNMIFGCEADMDKNYNIGLTKEVIDNVDFIVMSLTHFHIKGSIDENATTEDRSKIWIDRFNYFLDQDLPFHKFGIGHMTTDLVDNYENHFKIFNSIDDLTYKKIFTKAARLGVGIEINIKTENYRDEKELDMILRPYKIAKECGCKFYLGGDVHHPKHFEMAIKRFNIIIDKLNLTEDDKFLFVKENRK